MPKYISENCFQNINWQSVYIEKVKVENNNLHLTFEGLVPKEYSSESSRWQGSITKIGNAQIRRVLCESAWSYRH
ncbi:transposase, partial [Bacillus songklensis]